MSTIESVIRYNGEKLGRVMRERGLRKDLLEREIGMSQGYISRLTTGQRTTDEGTAVAIARALDLPFEDLFDVAPKSAALIAAHGGDWALRGPNALFWSKVKRGEGCWEWLAFRDPNGYGRIGMDHIPVLAHRRAWELTFGPIPPDMAVCHKCDNPPCCNPDHLFLGSQVENIRDALAKKRALWKPGGINQARGQRVAGAKLTEGDIPAIRSRHAAGETIAQMARDYGVTESAIRGVVQGKTWKHVP